MRDILFRGRDYHGIWRYGNLCHYKEESPVPETTEYYEQYTINTCSEEFEVIPETIGQLVWKSSDGSHEVWEGDIIECAVFRGGARNVCMAVWDINSLSFRLRWPGSGQYCSRYSFVGFLRNLFAEGEGVVIGNIHDNPRLFNEYKKKAEAFKETES